MASAARNQLVDLCRNVLGPLLKADGGVLHVVRVEDDLLSIHLSGACSGCPGIPITIKSVIEPTVRALSSTVQLNVTSGPIIPDGAVVMDDFEVDTSSK